MKKKFLKISLTLLSLILISLAVYAGQWRDENCGGGIWEWGLEDFDDLWSHYYHPDRRHGATVVNDNGTRRADNIDPGKTAKARIKTSISNNKAYYHRCKIDKDCGYPEY